MKRVLSLAISSLVVFSILAGCGTTQTSGSSNSKVQLEFYSYKPEAVGTFNKLIKEFEKENPNIEVTQINSPDSSTYIMSRVAKRNVPDIIAFGGDTTYQGLVKNGVLKDLSSNSLLKGVQPAYIKMLKDVGQTDKVYGIPYVANADAVIYNKAIFKKLGISVPQTWDQFIADCNKIKASGVNPFYFGYKDSWTAAPAYDALAANTESADFFKQLNQGKTTFAIGQKETMDKYLPLLNYENSDANGKGYNDANTAFAKGASAMYLQGIWAIPVIKAANPNIDLGVFPYPVSNTPGASKVVSGVDLELSESATTQHPKEAQKFLNFLMENNTIKQYIKEQNAFPAKKGIVQNDPELAGLKDSFAKGNVVDFPDHYIPSSVNLDSYLQVFVENKNVNQFLKSMDSDWQKVKSLQ